MNKIVWQALIPVMNNRLSDTYNDAMKYPLGKLKLIETDWGLKNDAFDETLVIYDANYHNNQSLSKAFQIHIDNVIDVISPYLKNKTNLTVEIGCGSGYFVELLQNQKINVMGYDPTYNGNNPIIIKEYFNENSHIKADFLILRHVLEHIINPKDFLYKLFNANGNAGKIYIEVPSLDWIINNSSYFDFTYEHCNYFSERGLASLFDKVIEKGVLFGGQYQYVIAEIGSYNPNRVKQNESYSFDDVEDKLHLHKQLLKSYDSIYVWGASGKGATFCQLMYENENEMEHESNIVGLIDINPEKFGKYVPLTGNKVYEYESTMGNEDTIFLVLNDEYYEEINAMCGNRAKTLEQLTE